MENIRITDLFAENVGPFESQHFHFPEKPNMEKAEIHLITGENGAGKSTLLMMLASLGKSNQIYKRFNSGNSNSAFKVNFANGESMNVLPKNGNLVISPLPKFLNSYWQKIEYPKNNTFDFAFFAYSGSRRLINSKLESIKESTESPFSNALNFNSSTNSQSLIQWIANQKTKEALAIVKNDLLKASNYRSSITLIEQCISTIIDKQVEFVLEEDPLNVVIKLDKSFLEFDVLPDGLKSIISWISDLLMRLDRIKWSEDVPLLSRRFILFLDEIDVHLHPAWQRKILPVIQVLFKNAQIFITTHSPFVIGSVDDAWIHKIILRDDKASNAEPILSEDSRSYTLILSEIFNIEGYFGIEIEKKLKDFRDVRNKLMHGNSVNPILIKELKRLIAFFNSQKSIELDNMIGFEIRQLSKILKSDILNAEV